MPMCKVRLDPHCNSSIQVGRACLLKRKFSSRISLSPKEVDCRHTLKLQNHCCLKEMLEILNEEIFRHPHTLLMALQSTIFRDQNLSKISTILLLQEVRTLLEHNWSVQESTLTFKIKWLTVLSCALGTQIPDTYWSMLLVFSL